MKCSLDISNFVEEISSLPILWFSSISLHWSLRKAFFFPLAILWNSAFKWIYLFFSPLPFASFLFSAICKASSDNHFAFLHFFPWGWSWSLCPVQRHKPPSIVLQALCLWDLILWIYLSLPLYNRTVCIRFIPFFFFFSPKPCWIFIAARAFSWLWQVGATF